MNGDAIIPCRGIVHGKELAFAVGHIVNINKHKTNSIFKTFNAYIKMNIRRRFGFDVNTMRMFSNVFITIVANNFFRTNETPH